MKLGASAPALIALALGALTAAGCAHVREPEHDGLSFSERRTRLESTETWEMRGRIAVDTGERAFQASFRWLQDDSQSTLSIRGPLGAGAMEITGSPEQMIVTARGERRVLEDPETDLSALLGWWMPVDSLKAWLLGLPDPMFAAETQLGPGEALTTLEQRLWEVDYEDYRVQEGLLVPRRIDMAHGALEVRLTVDTWSTAGTARRLELGGARTAQYAR